MLSYSFDQGINILDTAEMVSTELCIIAFPLLTQFPYRLKFNSVIYEPINKRLTWFFVWNIHSSFYALVPSSTQKGDSRED